MKKVYSTKEEILQNVESSNRITGVAELDIEKLLWNTQGIEYVYDEITDQIGGKYGYLFQNLCHSLVGCDVERGVVYIELSADITEVLKEIQEESEEE